MMVVVYWILKIHAPVDVGKADVPPNFSVVPIVCLSPFYLYIYIYALPH